MSDSDAHEELADLVRGFRGHLEWQRRAGAHSTPAGPSEVAVQVAPAAPAMAPPAAPAIAPPSAPSMAAEPSQVPDSGAAVPSERPARPSLSQVREELGDCQRCTLASARKNLVFGVGDPNASLIFIGEAPGHQEDLQGEPFVGPAGQLLDKMIQAMGWTRDTVYIANVLKCRPPGNRDPEPAEVEACEPFLARQLEALAPRIIVTLGKPAAHLLLRTTAPISALRGSFQTYRGITVMPTFHPAYLLRSPERKADTWNDLKKVIAEIDRLGISTHHAARG